MEIKRCRGWIDIATVLMFLVLFFSKGTEKRYDGWSLQREWPGSFLWIFSLKGGPFPVKDIHSDGSFGKSFSPPCLTSILIAQNAVIVFRLVGLSINKKVGLLLVDPNISQWQLAHLQFGSVFRQNP